MLTLINFLCLLGALLFFTGLALTSFMEKELRAFWISIALAALSVLFWTLIIPGAGPLANGLILTGLAAAAVVSLAAFFPGDHAPRKLDAADQYDERDTMFARNHIQNFPDLMETYYRLRPEHRSTDLQIHKKPEFGSREQTFHHELTAPVYLSAFEYLEKTIPLSDAPPAPEKKKIDPKAFARVIKEMARLYGACDTGIIKLAPHHFYSQKGRHAESWGQSTDQSYATAITIVVPMRVNMLKQGPSASVIQESAQKYVEAAKISNILAGFIRQFGYRARAHNDANYETLCVPLAVESGLGELGRMGIFMHKIHGPCVRLAVVTTEMELPGTKAEKNRHMADFCRICKKCADNCPSGSITHGDEPSSRGFRHWSIDQEKCFSYWKTIGSDCGMCISVCPYTKPDTLIHRFVRFYISRNILNQYIALFMDDLLYGRKTKIMKTNPEQIFLP